MAGTSPAMTMWKRLYESTAVVCDSLHSAGRMTRIFGCAAGSAVVLTGLSLASSVYACASCGSLTGAQRPAGAMVPGTGKIGSRRLGGVKIAPPERTKSRLARSLLQA
jgi:hypothetical protein